MPTADRIRGTLHLQLLANGTVAFVFIPGSGQMGTGNNSLLTKNADTAEEDLVRTWRFTSANAKSAIKELKLNGQVHREFDADAKMVAILFPK